MFARFLNIFTRFRLFFQNENDKFIYSLLSKNFAKKTASSDSKLIEIVHENFAIAKDLKIFQGFDRKRQCPVSPPLVAKFFLRVTLRPSSNFEGL